MAGLVEIEVDPVQIASIKETLKGVAKLVNIVQARAINKTTAGVRTDAKEALKTITTIKAGAVTKATKIHTATKTTPHGSIKWTSEPVALIDYSARWVKAGVKVTIFKDDPNKLIEHAFIRNVYGGKNVLWRKYFEPPSKPLRYAWGQISKYGKMPRKYRWPVEKLWGPGAAYLIGGGKDPILKALEPKAHKRFVDNIEHETAFELAKLK